MIIHSPISNSSEFSSIPMKRLLESQEIPKPIGFQHLFQKTDILLRPERGITYEVRLGGCTGLRTLTHAAAVRTRPLSLPFYVTMAEPQQRGPVRAQEPCASPRTIFFFIRFSTMALDVRYKDSQTCEIHRGTRDSGLMTATGC